MGAMQRKVGHGRWNQGRRRAEEPAGATKRRAAWLAMAMLVLGGCSGGAGPRLGPCPMLPADSPWNTEVTSAPLHPMSDAYVQAMGPATGLHPDFGTVYDGAPIGIPYVLVPPLQPRVPIQFTYADESDPGPYPIPANAPVEHGDRHILVVETGTCTLYEVSAAYPENGGFHADAGAIWHLTRNERRPDGWTSADAAGLPILPGLVRYDEVYQKSEIRHALRVTTAAPQRAFIYPAVHSDGVRDESRPPLGLRLRLKASFDISGFPPPLQVILQAMKTYGVFVADTGSNWYVSGVPDARWNDELLAGLRQVHGQDFEAVYTGPAHPY